MIGWIYFLTGLFLCVWYCAEWIRQAPKGTQAERLDAEQLRLLRRMYVEGKIEVDEFEADVERLLSGQRRRVVTDEPG